MKKPLAVFSFIFLLASCSENINDYTITGTAPGAADGTSLFLYELDGNNQPIAVDTLQVNNGAFRGTYPKATAPQTSLRYFVMAGKPGNVMFVPDNSDVSLTVYADSIQASTIAGSTVNENYSKFKTQLYEIAEEQRGFSKDFNTAAQTGDNVKIAEIQKRSTEMGAQMTQLKKDFIEENEGTLLTALLISEMLQTNQMTAAEAKAAVNNLPAHVMGTPQVKRIITTLTAMGKVAIGNRAPAFSGPTPQGETLALADALGEYTIIDFWASWCKPCRRENPNVVNVYNKYHDKGLNIISVSLDRQGQKARWEKAIADDKMDWYHVSNLKFWQDPIAQQYDVRSIPATFLLDKNGTIIAKNLRGEGLQTKMAALLGGQ